MADMTRDNILTQTRSLLGVTDSSKGGPVDADFHAPINRAVDRFCLKSGALKTVIKLSTKANDKYLPLVDEILWPITVSFLDADGRIYGPLDLVEVAPRPGSVGPRPSRWWHTHVNVPDATGRSTPTIGIDPYVSYDGTNNVIIEAIQSAQDLDSGSEVPELNSSLHGYLAYGTALEMVSLFPEKLAFVGYWESRFKEGCDMFRELSEPQRHKPKTHHDAMGYGRRMRTRL